MISYIREDDDPVFRRAALAVVSAQLGAVTFIQRRLHISFRDAEYLLDIMTRRGITGPARGSAARKVLVKKCRKCGRVGPSRYVEVPAVSDDMFRLEVGLDPAWMCENRTSCHNRWSRARGIKV